VRIAREFKKWVEQSTDFEVVVEPLMNLVCFRHKAGDDFNMKLMNSINQSGKIYFTHTKLNGKVVLRMNIGQTHIEEKHAKSAWEIIKTKAESMI
jgi:aromatic-L-amino-acid decarboxylase